TNTYVRNGTAPCFRRTGVQRMIAMWDDTSHKSEKELPIIMNISASKLIQATALAVALGGIPVAAQSEDDRSCSVASLKGAYGLHASGIRPVAGSNQSETHSTLARRSYDGKGGLKSWPVVSQGQVSGVAEGTGTAQTGTYEVNPDCTGQMTLTLGPIQLSARFVVVKQGLEIIEVPTTPGNIAVARLKRQ
ncbi:MAG: hypothetical protein JNK48_33730, partial [Bryobacterales bacterium]|nr:hypothetical protein [Bryobacterales bacterium]